MGLEHIVLGDIQWRLASSQIMRGIWAIIEDGRVGVSGGV